MQNRPDILNDEFLNAEQRSIFNLFSADERASRDVKILLVELAAIQDLREALTARDGIDLEKLKVALEEAPPTTMVGQVPASHIAVMRGSIPALSLLVAARASFDDTDDRGYNVLDVAHECGNQEMVDYIEDSPIFAARAQVFCKNGETPEDAPVHLNDQIHLDRRLDYKIYNSDANDVRMCLMRGANPNAVLPKTDIPRLEAATVRGDVAKVEALLLAGAHMGKRGGIMQSMWHAQGAVLYTPAWFAVCDLLQNAGVFDMFDKHPRDMTLDDFRVRKDSDDSNLMLYLSHMRRFDIIADLVKKNPDDRLTVADFLTPQGKRNETLISVLAGRGPETLKMVFSPDIWQGRIEAMMEVWNATPSGYFKNNFDITSAKADVVAHRLKHMAEKARIKKYKLGNSK